VITHSASIPPKVKSLCGTLSDGAIESNLRFIRLTRWSVAYENGVTEFFSEDFQAGRELKGLRFTNPF
jgi:hypothetical protein